MNPVLVPKRAMQYWLSFQRKRRFTFFHIVEKKTG
jgi:hypothetical protein